VTAAEVAQDAAVIVERTRRAVYVAAVCLSLLSAAESPARAAGFLVKLAYEARPGCPDAAEFASIVIARLGYDPFAETAPDHVLVRIAPHGSAIDGRTEWRDGEGRWTGEQTFPSVNTNCPHLARVMAFALAVQIQLLANRREPASPGGTAADQTPLPSPAAAPPPVEAAIAPTASGPPPTVPGAADVPPPPVEAPHPSFDVGAGPAVGFGMSSTPILLGRMFGAIAWPRTSVELAAEVSLPATTRRADGAGFSQQHLFLAAAACAPRAPWTGCVLARVGEIRMAGENIDRPTSAEVPVLEAGARVGYIHRLGSRGFWEAHADGLARLIRWTATLDKVPVWTAPRFAASFGVGAGVRFP